MLMSISIPVVIKWLRFFFFSSRRRHTRLQGDWSSDVCSSDLDRRQLLDQRARAAVPAEPVVGPSGDDVRPIHEPARVLEALLDAEQLEVVAVRATGAVAEGDGPQLARAAAVRSPGPRPGDLHFGEPDLAPHDVSVDAQDTVVVVAVDPVGVDQAERGRGPQVAAQAQQVVDGGRACGRLVAVVDGAET